MSAPYDSGMSRIQAYAHNATASYEHAAPLQTFSNGFPHMSQPQPSVGVPALHRRKRGRPRKYVPLAIVPAPHPSSDVPMGFSPPAMASPLPLPPPSANATTQRVRKRRVQGQSSTVTKKQRKYVDPTIAMPLAIVPAPHPPSDVPPAFSPPVMPPPPPPHSANAPQRVRKRRVTKKQVKVTAAGSSGVAGMNAEVITIQAGQDVRNKIMSLSGNGWAVCILSAHGALSNVTLRQGASSGDTVIYEGCFEIISLCGSYQLSETAGKSSHTGGLSVSIASLDGRLFAGAVTGPLIAASPVQVIVGRFPIDGKKKLNQTATSGIPAASSSTPRDGLNGSSGIPGSAPN